MTQASGQKTRKAFTHVSMAFIGSVFVGIVLLAALFYFADFGQVIETIQRANFRIILVALALDVAGLALYGAAWYALIRGAGLKIKFVTTEVIAMTGIFTCYITPSGFFMDVSRILLASREAKIKLGRSAATVVMHKILFTLGFVTFAFAGSIVLLGHSGSTFIVARNILLVAAAITVAMFAIALAVHKLDRLAVFAERPLKQLSSMLGKMIGKHEDTVSEQLDTFLSDFRETFVGMLRRPKVLVLPFVLTLLYWSTSISIMCLVFLSLDYPVPIWVAALTISVGDFVQMTPIAIPGMLGVLEVVFTSVLVALGVPLTIAASATVLVRICTFWFDLPFTGTAALYSSAKFISEVISGFQNSGDK